jgi:hypothetical protein
LVEGAAGSAGATVWAAADDLFAGISAEPLVASLAAVAFALLVAPPLLPVPPLLPGALSPNPPHCFCTCAAGEASSRAPHREFAEQI